MHVKVEVMHRGGVTESPDVVGRGGDEHRPQNEDDRARLAFQRDLERELGLREERVVELMDGAAGAQDEGRVEQEQEEEEEEEEEEGQ